MANEIIGNVIIGIGAVAVVLGLIGIFRFKEFNLKLLAGSKIDTVGLIAIVLGAAVRSGMTWFSAKALLLLAVTILVSPIVTSTIAAGARKAARPDAGEG